MKIVNEWRSAFRNPAFRAQFVVSIVVLAVILPLMGSFLNYIGARMGVELHDPILRLFRPIGFKWITFSLIYSGIVLGFVSLLVSPFSLLLALRALSLIIILRAICLFLVPLDPPSDGIPLVDPLIRFPGIRPVLPRDLFFSWQTALMTLFALTARWRDMKIIFSGIAFVVSLLLLLQHSHYTIDLVVAPCLAYAAYGIAKQFTLLEYIASPARTSAVRPTMARQQ